MDATLKLDELAEKARESLRRIAKVVSGLKDEHVMPMLDLTKQLGGAIYEIEKPVKERVKALLTSRGNVFTEAGSKELTLSGWRTEIRPTSGGWDRDALAALMKSLNIKRLQYMDMEKVYTPNQAKIDALVAAKKLSNKDLAKCKKESGWAVQTPTKVESEDE